MQPLSARCMHALLRFIMGAHLLPVVLGRRTGVSRTQRSCQRCNLHALHDESHLVFEGPAIQFVRGIGMLPCSVLLKHHAAVHVAARH